MNFSKSLKDNSKDFIPPEYLDELQGLADTSDVSYDRLFEMHLWTELSEGQGKGFYF